MAWSPHLVARSSVYPGWPPERLYPATPWLAIPSRRATPRIRQLTRGACDVGWTQALPLDGCLPRQDRFHSTLASCEVRITHAAYLEKATRASAHWPSRGSPVAKTHRSRAPSPFGAETLASRVVCPEAAAAGGSGNVASDGPVQESA